MEATTGSKCALRVEAVTQGGGTCRIRRCPLSARTGHPLTCLHDGVAPPREREMEEVPDSSTFRRDAWISAGFGLCAAAALLVRWWLTSSTPSLLAGLGLATLTRIWFIAPIDFVAYARSFNQPAFGKARIVHPHRRFSGFDGLLVLVGWGLLLASAISWGVGLLG